MRAHPLLRILLASLPCMAHPALAATTETAPSMTGSLLQMLLGLALVIAMLLATLWALKRLSHPQAVGGALKVIGATAVGQRERVVLVELGDEVLVLGVAPGSVRALHRVPRSSLPEGSPGTGFSSWLKRAQAQRQPS